MHFCIIESCEKKHFAKGYCSQHYYKLIKKFSQAQKDYVEKVKEKMKIYLTNYRKTHPWKKEYNNKRRNYLKHKAKEDYYKNKDSRIEYQIKWKNENPEKVIEYVKKIAIVFEKSTIEMGRALWAWSKLVRKRDNNLCQNCGRPAVDAHHIFRKSKYPGLALNLNNGISLCHDCHCEVY